MFYESSTHYYSAVMFKALCLCNRLRVNVKILNMQYESRGSEFDSVSFHHVIHKTQLVFFITLLLFIVKT